MKLSDLNLIIWKWFWPDYSKKTYYVLPHMLNNMDHYTLSEQPEKDEYTVITGYKTIWSLNDMALRFRFTFPDMKKY